jgi:hypothetical protein
MDKYGYWKPHVSNSSLLSVPKISRAVKAVKKTNNVNDYYSLSNEIFPNLTFFGLPLYISPIMNVSVLRQLFNFL